MELKKPPFTPNSCLNYKRYREARQEFLEKEYVGMIVEFEHDLVGISGSLSHAKGEIVQIIAIDCDLFKVKDKNGPITGLFKPQAFKD